MGKKPKLKPSFFKIMFGDFTHQLQIPLRFVLHYNDILSKKLLLKISGGDFWAVKLKKENHEMFFGEGWSGFVKDNSLEVGDLLVFRSLGDSKFNVNIYGKDCCEKERIPEGRKTDKCRSCEKKANQGIDLTLTEDDQLCDSKEPRVNDRKESEDEVSLEILGEDWCKTNASPRNEVFNKGTILETCNTKNNLLSTRRSLSSCTKSKNLRKSKSKNNDACQIEKKDNRHVSCISRSSLKQSRVSLNKMAKRKIEQGLADGKRDEGNGHGKRSKNSEPSVSKDACSTDEEVVSVSIDADSSDEDVVSVSKDADSTDEEVELSSNKDAESTDAEVELSVSIDADSTDEEVRLKVSKDANSTDEEVGLGTSEDVDSTDEEVDLSASEDTDSTYEVSDFSVSEDVNSTDEEVELGVSKDAASTDKEVQLHGFEQRTRSYHRAESSPQVTRKYRNLSGSKRKPVTLQETGQSTDAASRLKSKYPFFIVHLGSSYVNKGYLHIRMDFADKYLPKRSTNACIVDSSERTWIVRYKYKKHRTYFGKHLESGRACFSRGWKELVVGLWQMN